MNQPKEPIVIKILRILLGLLFIFSGLSKAIDPVASAIQFDDYFYSFHLPFMQFFSMFMAIAMNILETTLGVMMLFRIKIKFTSLIFLLFMCFFFLLTAWLALAEYLEVYHGYDFGVVKDCGCFGKAIKLNNYQTFLKNIAIIIPTFIVFMYRRQIPDIRLTELGKWLFTGSAALMVGLLQWYCYCHLPIIDFSDWKIGTNVAENYIDKQEVIDKNNLTYPYKDSAGTVYSFTEDEMMKKYEEDPTFFDNKEALEPQAKILSPIQRAPIQGFTMEDSINDYSADLLNTHNKRPLYILFMHYLDETDMDGIQNKELKRIVDWCAQNGADFVAITNSSKNEIASFKKEHNIHFPIYHNECDIVKGPFIIRDAIHANPGLIYVQNGIVKGKWAWRDYDDVELSK